MSRYFNTVNGYFTIADNSALTFPNSDWSFGGWFRLPDNSGSAFKFLFDWASGGTARFILFLYEEDVATIGDSLRCQITDADGTPASLITDVSIGVSREWQHVLIVKSGSTIKMYMDGVLKDTDSASGLNAIDVPNTMFVGARGTLDSGQYSKGDMAEWAKWDSAMSVEQIASLADGIRPPDIGTRPSWYIPMLDSLYEEIAGLSISEFNLTLSEHPLVTQPSNPLTIKYGSVYRPLIIKDGIIRQLQNGDDMYLGGLAENLVPYTGADKSVDLNGQELTTGTLKSGTSTDYSEFEADGTLKFNGDAAVWDDVRVVPGAFSFAGVGDPTLSDWQPSSSGATFKVYKFQIDDEVFMSCQLPHSYIDDSDVYFHIHWTPGDRGNVESGATVGWKVDYTWANKFNAFAPSSTVDLSSTCSGTDDYHERSSDVLVSGTGKEFSSIFYLRVYRSDTGSDDTWAGATAAQSPAILEFDIHHKIDTIGSRSKDSK